MINFNRIVVKVLLKYFVLDDLLFIFVSDVRFGKLNVESYLKAVRRFGVLIGNFIVFEDF